MEPSENLGMAVREVSANGSSMKTTEVEAKLDEGNIQEAESSLREGLSLNFEVSMMMHTASSWTFDSLFIWACRYYVTSKLSLTSLF